MDLQQRINAFVKLGEFMGRFSNNGVQNKEDFEENDSFINGFRHQIQLAEAHNGWFSEANILFALDNWSKALSLNNIEAWLKKYSFKNIDSKKVAVIMAGNIPLVGFHDFVSVLVSGHEVVVKLSSNDQDLLTYLGNYLEHVEPGFKGKITFLDGKLEAYDAVIATGSNNTARYFEYYFKGKPSIIRKNRNSVAILTGNETQDELEALSHDIFRYFGLGCRNVSKMFVPNAYDFDPFFKAMFDWNPMINHTKYANNYDYNKAVYLMSEVNILDNGFFMVKEDQGYVSPISTVFYEYYNDLNQLKQKLNSEIEQLQCVVSKGVIETEISFGETQNPKLWDYADHVDTIEFLLKI